MIPKNEGAGSPGGDCRRSDHGTERTNILPFPCRLRPVRACARCGEPFHPVQVRQRVCFDCFYFSEIPGCFDYGTVGYQLEITLAWGATG